MVHNCCPPNLTGLQKSQRIVLITVLWINAVMFIVEVVGGIHARSTSLLADSLDMLGDTLIYWFTLYVMTKSIRWKLTAALVKGVVMSLLGIGILVEAAFKFLSMTVPDAHVMSGIGAMALVANIICAALIFKHRNDDLNMKSTWLCSRNDMIAGVGILLAAGLVHLTGQNWPDLVVGGSIATLIIFSGYGVVRESIHDLQKQGTSN